MLWHFVLRTEELVLFLPKIERYQKLTHHQTREPKTKIIVIENAKYKPIRRSSRNKTTSQHVPEFSKFKMKKPAQADFRTEEAFRKKGRRFELLASDFAFVEGKHFLHDTATGRNSHFVPLHK